MFSALEALAMMCYINLRFTLHYITLHSRDKVAQSAQNRVLLYSEKELRDC